MNKRSAQAIIAEIGVEMSHFPSHNHLCSWVKLSPGHPWLRTPRTRPWRAKDGAKRKRGGVGKENRWLRATLIECAHAAGHSKATYSGSQFRRFAACKGKKRTAVTVAHSMLEAISFILRDKVPYRDLGASYLDESLVFPKDERNKHHIIRHHVRRLESFGLKVNIQEVPQAA